MPAATPAAAAPPVPAVRCPGRGFRRVAGAALLTACVGVAVAAPADAAETVWDRVALCESGGNWSINTGNGYYGGLQFSAGTWAAYGGVEYAARADLAAKSVQIYIAKRVLQGQGPSAWPTCGERAGLTVENGLAVVVYPKMSMGGPATAIIAGKQDPGTTAGAQTRTVSATRTRLGAGAGTGAGPGAGTTASPTAGVIPLVVDGILGPQTTKAVEIWVGALVDGSLHGSDTRLLQGELGSAQDGIIGPITTAALQRRVGTPPTGTWDSATTRALQIHLNALLG